MTEHATRRRRRRAGGEDQADEELEERAEGDLDEEGRALAGFPPVAPAREAPEQTSRPLVGGPQPEELDPRAPRRVPAERDELGRVVETVEAVDRTAAEHWDERRWNRLR